MFKVNKTWLGKKVMVILGGLSKEREVSLRTGKAIYDALCERGYTAKTFDPLTDDFSDFMAYKPDVCFLALHGNFGEDGKIQGFLSTLKIPYTHSAVYSSAVCMDKSATKTLLKPLQITMAESITLYRGESFDDVKMPEMPVVVKPSREGSTVGISIVRFDSELKTALEQAFTFDDTVLVEKFIAGKELTVTVLNGKALPIIEIAPKSGFYDYESKYTPGKTEYLVPAPLKEETTHFIQQQSEAIYKAMGCRGVARIDYILDNQNVAWFLEVNTIPGMTVTSLVPKSAGQIGIDFATLCEIILDNAGI